MPPEAAPQGNPLLLLQKYYIVCEKNAAGGHAARESPTFITRNIFCWIEIAAGASAARGFPTFIIKKVTLLGRNCRRRQRRREIPYFYFKGVTFWGRNCRRRRTIVDALALDQGLAMKH